MSERKIMREEGEITNRLTADCMARMISFLGPRGAGVLSTVSSAFQSVADSDAVWRHFLPPDCLSLLATGDEPLGHASFKEFFLRLCRRPVLIGGGTMSFGLERSTGAKCFTISARAMKIMYSEDDQRWTWIPLSDSRFSEAILLKCHPPTTLIRSKGKIDCKILSPETLYESFLIFRLEEGAYGFGLSTGYVKVNKSIVATHTLCLNPNLEFMRARPCRFKRKNDKILPHFKLPKDRRDGWMEIEMGEFYSCRQNETAGDGDGVVTISLWNLNYSYPMKGLVILGIDIRPKMVA